MLNIKRVELVGNATRYVPVGFLIGLVFMNIIINKVPVGNWGDIFAQKDNTNTDLWVNISELHLITNTNIQALGDILYTHYSIYFIMSGIILLIAMIGAIILTISHEEEIKRQDIFSQIATEFDKTVILKK